MKNHFFAICITAFFMSLLCSCGESTVKPDILDDTSAAVTARVTDTEDSDWVHSDTADTLFPTDTIGEAGITPVEKLYELGDGLEFYHFDDGSCTLVYNEAGAWVFDYTINRVTPVVDLDAMLTAADRTGRGGEYFEDVIIGYEFAENSGTELCIHFNVNSVHDDSHYSVYGFYPLSDEGFDNFGYGFNRGEFRGYYMEEISYPGSDEAAVIYDVNDYAKLGIRDDDWLFCTARAIIENDVPELEYRLLLESGVLSDWEGMEISDYSITNRDVNSQFIDGLEIYLNITESRVERYPAGEYSVRIVDGLGTRVEFTPLDGDIDEVSYSDAAEWLYTYASRYGGSMPPEEQVITNYSYAHMLVDFYLYSNEFDSARISWDGFREFCRVHFGIEVTEDHVSVADVESHGGHGGGGVCCEIVDELSASGIHFITVNYYADPMKSKVAYTHVFTVVENDGFEIDACERTYDANLRPESWSA